jgi:hypothetical protein
MDTEVANGPVALTRGFAGMSVKAGTLEIVNPKTNAILNRLSNSKVSEGAIRKTIDIRATQAKDKEDKNPAGKVFPAKPSYPILSYPLSSIPGLPKLSP